MIRSSQPRHDGVGEFTGIQRVDREMDGILIEHRRNDRDHLLLFWEVLEQVLTDVRCAQFLAADRGVHIEHLVAFAVEFYVGRP